MRPAVVHPVLEVGITVRVEVAAVVVVEVGIEVAIVVGNRAGFRLLVRERRVETLQADTHAQETPKA